MTQSCATPWRSSQAASACSRSARASGSSVHGSGLDLAAQRVERGELVRRDVLLRQPAQRGQQRLARCRRASTARVAAAAGLLISWARPAASVPRVTSASRCRAVDSIERAVRKRPSIRCAPNGNQAWPAREAPPPAPQAPGRRWSRGRWRGRRRGRPRPGSRRPTTRARPSGRPRCPRGRPGGRGRSRRRRAPTRSRRARPRGTARRRARPRTSAPASSSSASWSSVSPSKSSAGAGRRRASDRRQVAVHEVDRHRALADGRGDPLHRVEPHVAGGEHPGHARLQRERRPGQRPAGGVAAAADLAR